MDAMTSVSARTVATQKGSGLKRSGQSLLGRRLRIAYRFLQHQQSNFAASKQEKLDIGPWSMVEFFVLELVIQQYTLEGEEMSIDSLHRSVSEVIDFSKETNQVSLPSAHKSKAQIRGISKRRADHFSVLKTLFDKEIHHTTPPCLQTYKP